MKLCKYYRQYKEPHKKGKGTAEDLLFFNLCQLCYKWSIGQEICMGDLKSQLHLIHMIFKPKFMLMSVCQVFFAITHSGKDLMTLLLI